MNINNTLIRSIPIRHLAIAIAAIPLTHAKDNLPHPSEASAAPTTAPIESTSGSVDEMALLAKKTANPISDLWLLWNQVDSTKFKGDLLDDDEWMYSYKFQPVMSFPILGGDWNFILRPVIQYNSVPLDKDAGQLLGASQGQIFNSEELSSIAADPFGTTTGFGDTILLTLLGPNKEDGNIWGIGASQILPTAQEDVLGQGKYQAGPAFLFAHIAPEPGKGWKSFNYGLLAQHWWSYAGDDDRSETSQTDIQYFINYRLNNTALIGMTPNIRINWREDGSDRFSVPIGLGYIDMIKIGKVPVRVGMEAQYYVHQPDQAGADWNFRIIFTPIIPRLFGD